MGTPRVRAIAQVFATGEHPPYAGPSDFIPAARIGPPPSRRDRRRQPLPKRRRFKTLDDGPESPLEKRELVRERAIHAGMGPEARIDLILADAEHVDRVEDVGQ